MNAPVSGSNAANYTPYVPEEDAASSSVAAAAPAEGKASLLSVESGAQLGQPDFDNYLVAVGKLYEVGADGMPEPSRRRYAMDSQLVKLVQASDSDLDEAVADYNKAHADAPLNTKTLNLTDVALLRKQGLYSPGEKIGQLLDCGQQLHEQARGWLEEARHAASTGDENAAREAVEQFDLAHGDLLKLQDDYAHNASEAARGTVRNWQRALTTSEVGFFFTSSLAVFAAALHPVSRSFIAGRGVAAVEAATGVGAGTGLGMLLAMYKHGGQEVVNALTGMKTSVSRFAGGVVNDTLNSFNTSLSGVMAPVATSQLAARALQPGARVAVWAMDTQEGQAVSGGVIGGTTDAVGQGVNIATHSLRRDGTQAPDFSWRSVGVSTAFGAGSRVIGCSLRDGGALPAAASATRQFAHHNAETAIDVATGSAQIVAMNIGTDQPLLGTAEQHLNSALNSIALGRASAMPAGTPGQHGAPPAHEQSSGGWSFADAFGLPAFGLVAAGDAPVPHAVFMAGKEGGGQENSGKRGVGGSKSKASTVDKPAATAASERPSFYEGKRPMRGGKADPMDGLLANVMGDLGGSEALARKVLSRFADTTKVKPTDARDDAKFMLNSKNPKNRGAYVDFLDKQMKGVLEGWKAEDGPPPLIHVEGKFLALGVSPMPRGQADPFDVLLNEVSAALGDEQKARRALNSFTDGNLKWVKEDRARATEVLDGGDKAMKEFIAVYTDTKTDANGFPKARYSKAGRVDLEEHIGRDGHRVADYEEEGGVGQVFQGHGWYPIGDDPQVFVVPQGTAVTVLRPGVPLPTTNNSIPLGSWDGFSNYAHESSGAPADFDMVEFARDVFNADHFELGPQDMHPYFEGAVTWLPGARIPDYFVGSPRGVPVFENSLSLRDGVEKPISAVIPKDAGNLNLAICTAAETPDGSAPPLSLHGKEFEPLRLDLPGRYVPGPTHGQTKPSDKNYRHDWVPDPNNDEVMGWNWRDPRDVHE